MIVTDVAAEAFHKLDNFFRAGYMRLKDIPIIGEFAAQPFDWASDQCFKLNIQCYHLGTTLDNIIATVEAQIGDVINVVYDGLHLGDVYSAIKSFVDPIFSEIWEFVSPLYTYISNIAADVSRGFAAIPSLLFDGLEKLTLNFFDGFELITGNIFSLIIDVYANARDLVENFKDYVWAALGSGGEFLTDLSENFTERVGEVVFGPLMTADDWLNSKMSDIASYVMNHISEFIDDILEAIFDTLEAHMDKWSDRIMKVIEEFMEHV